MALISHGAGLPKALWHDAPVLLVNSKKLPLTELGVLLGRKYFLFVIFSYWCVQQSLEKLQTQPIFTQMYHADGHRLKPKFSAFLCLQLTVYGHSARALETEVAPGPDFPIPQDLVSACKRGIWVPWNEELITFEMISGIMLWETVG